MASLSPPYPSNSPLPAQSLKRRQSDMPNSGPSIKRRKASLISNSSGSAHPLRQTSFPPEVVTKMERISRSPSFDSVSLVSGVSTTKKKKTKKGKGKENDDSSLIGGAAKSAVSAGSARGKGRTSKEREEEEEEEDTGGADLAADMVVQTQEEKRKEQIKRAMLIQAFDDEQSDRHLAWLSSKLPDATVRRIVNQTLSQSVPATVILAIKSVTKVFVGEMVEDARKVQTQWDRTDEGITALPGAQHPVTKSLRAPLQADHLREALRRRKVSGEGNEVGDLGLWQLQHQSGVERFGVKTSGKRLFK